MKTRIKYGLLLFFVCGTAWGCEWGIRTDVDEDADATDVPGDRIDSVETPPDALPDPDAGDPDIAPDADAGDPDGADPDAPPDTPDVIEDEVSPLCGNGSLDGSEECDDGPDNSDTEPDACRTDCTLPGCGDGVTDSGEECDDGAANSDTDPDACRTDCRSPICGDGVTDSGEDCDDASGFCTDCSLVLPSGWIECTDSAGNTAFLFILTIPGNRPWADFRDQCVSEIEAYSPEDFEFYGLAVFSDEDIWDCIEPSLNDFADYFVGLAQDTTAGDYSEPDGGWYWTAYNGTDWVSVAPFDPDNGFLDGSFDNGGGGGSVECGRITNFLGNWEFSDYSCTASTGWDGICMIQF